jgi:hypothetical protein
MPSLWKTEECPAAPVPSTSNVSTDGGLTSAFADQSRCEARAYAHSRASSDPTVIGT